MNPLDALRRMVDNYPGGRHALAVRLGKSEEVLRKELGGGQQHKMGVVDAAAIAALCTEAGSPQADALAQCVAAESHGQFVAASQATSATQTVLDGLGNQSKEAAELMQMVLHAMSDGVVSDNDMSRIEKEALDVMLSMQSLVAACRLNNKTSKLGRVVL